ncbi:ribosomal RNA small subunit methyltransferase NEP1-like [Clavelina lepadiformis]|uniref:ribosomal RNA small subunit methyltransferase NEP1-like n=1 Tax=Clavelina lepadiformis TaxID=159417 RepID=UPI0040435069
MSHLGKHKIQYYEEGNDEDSIPTKGLNLLRKLNKHNVDKRLIVILVHASLETVKVGKSYELLNCDKHKSILRKNKRDPGSCRPDITHQCLLMLLDSPLNRAGLLQVYVETTKNVLIEINPQTRIPRTFDRFCGLMVQLLHKLSVRGTDAPVKLLKVIKGPVTTHLPAGCQCIGTSFSADVSMVKDIIPSDKPIAFVIGAMAHGTIKEDYTEKSISISSYPLSAALACTKICSATEDKWNII